MNVTGISGWGAFVTEGEQYLKAATGGAEKRPSVFTPEIVYNLTSMAVEKYLMGFLMFHGALPENHTLTDIMRAVERVAGSQQDLSEATAFLESFQEICDLETYRRTPPDAGQLRTVLAIGRRVQGFVAEQIAH